MADSKNLGGQEDTKPQQFTLLGYLLISTRADSQDSCNVDVACDGLR